jgi:sucrose phosphorylase
LDLCAGTNDYTAADRGGTAGHKEINRTTLSLADVENGLETAVVQEQLKLLKLRNAHPAFAGKLEIHEAPSDRLHLAWRNGGACVALEANLRSHDFSVTYMDGKGIDGVMRFSR